MNPASRHVYPVAREHVTNAGHDCWCEPVVFQLCPDCDGTRCTTCDFEGWVRPYDPERAYIYVHQQ